MTRWYLDACALINLYASEQLEAVVDMHGSSFLVVPTGLTEAAWVYERKGSQRGEKFPIPLDDLVRRNILEIVAPTSAMWSDFIALARDLDDGEAMTLAATLRTENGGLITDDEAALSYMESWPTLPRITSLNLLRQLLKDTPLDTCREVLANLSVRARYMPGPRHPEFKWWHQVTQIARQHQEVESLQEGNGSVRDNNIGD